MTYLWGYRQIGTLIKEKEFINYRRQITRGEMARIIARVLEANGEDQESIEEYEIKINDSGTIIKIELED